MWEQLATLRAERGQVWSVRAQSKAAFAVGPSFTCLTAGVRPALLLVVRATLGPFASRTTPKSLAMDDQPNLIPEDQRPFVLQKCRHEFGHYVIAKVLGFRTGDLSFRLTSLNGHHVGSSEVMVQTSTPDVPSILAYLERRIVVLYSGAMAEATSAQDVSMRLAKDIFARGGAEGDMVKIEELIAVHLNISQPDAMEDEARVLARRDLMSRLCQEAARMVRAEHSLISELATLLAQHLTAVGRGAGLHAKDIDDMEPMKTRFGNGTIAS